MIICINSVSKELEELSILRGKMIIKFGPDAVPPFIIIVYTVLIFYLKNSLEGVPFIFNSIQIRELSRSNVKVKFLLLSKLELSIFCNLLNLNNLH
jgi:hypothetical protein